jgi:hypothetical protein
VVLDLADAVGVNNKSHTEDHADIDLIYSISKGEINLFNQILNISKIKNKYFGGI